MLENIKEFGILTIILLPAYLGYLILKYHVFAPKRKRVQEWTRNYRQNWIGKDKKKRPFS